MLSADVPGQGDVAVTRLHTYAPMRRMSRTRQRQEPDFQAVYRLVDQRSEGRCEVELALRCGKRATDHHHLVKPRRSHHQPELIVHMCRAHHERCAWPFKRGRLVWLFPEGGQMREFAIRYASDKFAARQS